MTNQPLEVGLLRVGPSANGGVSLDDIRCLWEDFEQSIALPIRYERIEFAQTELDSPRFAASFVQPDESRFCSITVGPHLLGVGPAEQRLTLLHETIHLNFLCGELAERNVEYHRKWDMVTTIGTSDAGFEDQLIRAIHIWNFIQEIVAEKYLSLEYPHLAVERAHWLFRQRRNIDSLLSNLTGSARACQGFYECLRCDLLAELLPSGTEAHEVKNAAGVFELEARRSGWSVQPIDELFALRPLLLTCELNPVRYEIDAYEKVYERASTCSR